jgi:hypothetical protein
MNNVTVLEQKGNNSTKTVYQIVNNFKRNISTTIKQL